MPVRILLADDHTIVLQGLSRFLQTQEGLEVVGQVASQTLENMGVIGSVARLPVLRPLVGFDKDEITAAAEKLGTYGISIIPDQDCCTLFTPRHPATKARMRDVEAAESTLPIEEMIEKALTTAEVEDFKLAPNS